MSSDKDLLQSDKRARKDALDVHRSFIVQAPAGSGKTELLIQRYLCLLATVDNPEEVLAISFTRKAATEMRLRVVQALQNAAQAVVAKEAHEQITADAALAVLRRDREADWSLMANPKRMKILTLDSLNASIARMQPLTMGATSSNAAVDMNAMHVLYRKAAAATLDFVGEPGYGGKAIETVLLHLDNNTGSYVEYLSKMLMTRDQWLPFISSGDLSAEAAAALRERFEGNLLRVVCDHLENLHAGAPTEAIGEIFFLADYAAGNLVADGNTDHPISSLMGIKELPGVSAESQKLWQALAELLLRKDGGIRKQLDKRIGFPPGNKDVKQRMSDLLESLESTPMFVQYLHASRGLPPTRYTDEQWSVLVSLFQLLPIAAAELSRLSSARGLTDYVEIGISAGDALGDADQPGDVALLLDYQVRHILVDEMQDTSKAQYRMLEALTGGWQKGDGRTLFCVGDPMQSIYRFRNAEVAQFLLARENGIGSIELEPLLLRQNFRSGEFLVHWFNTVFPIVLSDFDNPANGAVSYSESVPVEKLIGQGEFHLYPVLGSDRNDEAQQSFSIIQKTLADHPDDDMAVLVRGRSHLPELLQKLRDAGIAYEAIDIDRLTDLPEIIDVLALTRAFAHLGDRLAWLGLLRSPWVGLTWSDMHYLVLGVPHANVLECLTDDERVSKLSRQGQQSVEKFLALIDPHLKADRSTELHNRVEAAWFDLGGPGLLRDAGAVENVYRYFEILASLETGGTLLDFAELQNQLDSEHVSTNAAARLQIMTMHKAKGLQFDHVLLHGLGRSPRPRTPAVLSWFDLPDTQGGEEKIISPVGRRDDLTRDSLHQFIEKTEQAKDAHETGRLLYVACTRAKKSLHLVGNARLSKNLDRLLKPVSSTLLSLLWPAVENQYEDVFKDYTAPPDDSDQGDSIWIQPVLRRFETQWTLPELAALPGQPDLAGEEEAGAYKVDYYWVGVDARLAGTVVHRWLQLAADGKATLDKATLNDLRPASKRWLRELGAGDSSIGAICDRVVSALEGVVGDEKGRWLLQADGFAELALSAYVNGKIQSIVIDRVCIDEDGTHWIVDYKTSTHEGGNLDAFLQAESDRYRGQLSKYARIYADYSGAAIRCALYFPLLREFVEVDVQR